MRFTADGLIIRETTVGESNRIVVVLTRERGLISAFVGGAKSMKSKNTAGTALLTYSELTFTQKGENYQITESEAKEVFFGLRNDIFRMSLAQYICEICQAIVPYELESEDFLRLVLNVLHFTSKGEKDVYLLKAIAELRLMTVAGFMPDLDGCKTCGSEENLPMFLNLVGGDILCNTHKAPSEEKGPFAELDATTFAAMRHIVYSPLERLFSFAVPKDAARYLSFVTERYLITQTDRKYKALDFFHSLETMS